MTWTVSPLPRRLAARIGAAHLVIRLCQRHLRGCSPNGRWTPGRPHYRALQRWLLTRFSPVDLLTDRPLPGSRRVRGVRRSSPRTKGKRRRTATSATRSTPGVGCWTLVRNSWPVAADPSTTPAAAAGLSCSTSPSPCWPRRLPERGARRRGLGAEPGAGARVDYRCQKQPSGEQVPATSSAAYAGCSATSCQWQPVRWPKQCLSLTRQV